MFLSLSGEGKETQSREVYEKKRKIAITVDHILAVPLDTFSWKEKVSPLNKNLL